MNLIFYLLIALLVFPSAVSAQTLEQRVHTAALRSSIKHPDIYFFSLTRAFSFPEYRKFLSQQVKTIMGEKTSISFRALLQQPYFKQEFAGLTEAQRAKLAEIAGKEDAADTVTEAELLTMLVLLDANLERNPVKDKEQFKMDTFPSIGEKGGLANAFPNEITSLYNAAQNYVRVGEQQRAPSSAAERQAQKEAQARADLSRVRVYNGNVWYPSEAAKAMGLLRIFAQSEANLQDAAKAVFGPKLKTAKSMGTRSNDVFVELEDGTKLETQWNLSVTVIIESPNGARQQFGEDGSSL